jgi:hypothetical protein
MLRVRLGAQGRGGDGHTATIRVAGRVTAGGRTARSRKVRTPQGRTLGKPQAAKADGKWNRKETATGERLSPETPAVRVKRWGKSPPAPWRHGGSPNPVRCKAKQAPETLPAEGPGAPLEPAGNGRPREMVTLDRIRLTGLLPRSLLKGASPLLRSDQLPAVEAADRATATPIIESRVTRAASSSSVSRSVSSGRCGMTR